MENHSKDALSHNSTEKNVELEQIEVGQQHVVARPSRGQKIKRHCQRFWWLHLIIFCASFLIIALCLVYVALPKIAQQGVDDTTLDFQELKFLNPTSNSITITQHGTLHSPSIFTPTIDPFNASLYLVDQNGNRAANPFGVIQMPSIYAAHGDSSVGIDDQVIQISNVDLLADYCTAVLSQENVTSALTGTAVLHEGALPTVNINYHSLSTYKTLNGLAGFNVTNVTLDLGAKPGQPNIKGIAYIPNPSTMTIAMGNVTMDLSTAIAGILGNSTINDMTIVPGVNNFPMTGILDQALVLKSLDQKTGLVDMKITGRSAVYNGQHLTYYEKALSSNVLDLKMNVTQILADSAAAAGSSHS